MDNLDLSFLSLLRHTFDLIKENWKVYLKIISVILGISVVFYVVGVSLMLLYTHEPFSISAFLFSQYPVISLFTGGTVLTVGIAIPFIVVSALLILLPTIATINCIMHKDRHIVSLYKQGIQRLPAVIAGGLFLMIFSIGIYTFVVFLAPLFAFLPDYQFFLLVTIGCIWIFLYLQYGFFIEIIVEQENGALDALGMSGHLVKRNFIPVLVSSLGVFFLLALLSFFIQYGLVFLFLGPSHSITYFPFPPGLGVIVIKIISLLVTILCYVFWSVFHVVQYRDLVQIYKKRYAHLDPPKKLDFS